jgi:hypothetical protein
MVTDRDQPGWQVVLLGVVGSYASVFGIIYTLLQVRHLSSEAEIIKKTAEETKQRLFEFEHFGSLATAIKLVQEIQGYARSRKYELAVARLQELKIAIERAKHVLGGKNPERGFDDSVRTINFQIASMEKEFEVHHTQLRISAINSELETIMDFLVRIQNQLLAK